jgi:hypothetical protein
MSIRQLGELVYVNQQDLTAPTVRVSNLGVVATTGPDTFEMDGLGFTTNALAETWSNVRTRVQNCAAVQANPNPTDFVVQDTVFITDNATLGDSTASIAIQANESAGVGTFYGMNLYNSTNTDFVIQSDPDYTGGVLFTNGGTSETKITQGLIEIIDTITTSFTATTLTSGSSSATWADLIAGGGGGGVGTLNQVLNNGNTATGATASISLLGGIDDLVTSSITNTQLVFSDAPHTSSMSAVEQQFSGVSATAVLNEAGLTIVDTDISTILSASQLQLNQDTPAETITLTTAGLATTADLTLDIGNDLVLNGAEITTQVAGGFTAEYLRVKINGIYYKVQLLAD